MIAEAMSSATAPVKIPTNTELQLHTTTNILDAMESVVAKHFRANGRQRRTQNVVTTPRSPKSPNTICVKACSF